MEQIATMMLMIMKIKKIIDMKMMMVSLVMVIIV